MAGFFPNVRTCRVISIDDPIGANRIKVRMLPEDAAMSDEDIIADDKMFAIPLIPLLIYMKPKVGEDVLVLTSVLNDGYSQRYYIGPVISQLNRIEADEAVRSLFRGSPSYPDVNPENRVEETYGAYPSDTDIVISGRRNTDIQFKENDVRLRCGVKKSNVANRADFTFNEKDPAYIKLKYYENNDEGDFKSTATIVADKINLLSHQAKDHYKITDRKDLIDDETMAQIVEKAHQLPYGDVLVEFLTLFRDAFVNHTHPFPTKKPCNTVEMQNLSAYNMDKILSNNIRIN